MSFTDLLFILSASCLACFRPLQKRKIPADSRNGITGEDKGLAPLGRHILSQVLHVPKQLLGRIILYGIWPRPVHANSYAVSFTLIFFTILIFVCSLSPSGYCASVLKDFRNTPSHRPWLCKGGPDLRPLPPWTRLTDPPVQAGLSGHPVR